MPQKFIIAIDGPAGSGKSTTARIIAERLGFLYIDTGAMYRAVTYLALKKNVLNNIDEITRISRESEIKLESSGGFTRVWLNDEEVTEELRSMEVSSNVSAVSKIEEVREILVSKQRRFADFGSGVVMEGRDIGTVVFPHADVKIFLTASLDARAQRRAKEFEDHGNSVPTEEIKNNLASRDEIDSTRDVSPLVKAEDAIEIDTSYCTIDEQVEIILEQVYRTADKKGVKLNQK